MIKKATTLEEQVALLRNRGVEITDEGKARECLLDIGYYRLGSYLFPFEKTYPRHKNRTHEFIAGTRLADAVALYYFDFDLRNILNRYLSRIEVALKTYITYTLSNKYKDSPTWFVDPGVMTDSYVRHFDKVYAEIKKSPVIQRHHKKYPADRYAPAWKTIEYMTFGNLERLYINLKDPLDKQEISRKFGVKRIKIFENYLVALLALRNLCAHNGVLFDLRLTRSLKSGPAGTFTRNNDYCLSSVLKVVEYILRLISVNRLEEMKLTISDVLHILISKYPQADTLLKKTAGLLQDKK